MQFTIPNSAGFADIDEANVQSSNGWTGRGKKKCKRSMREFNSCHTPGTGEFCSGKQAAARFKGTVRRAGDKGRANRVMGRLESQMKGLAKNRPWVIYSQKGAPQQSRVDRAVTLRKRMDVAGPLATRDRQNSFIGTVKRALFKNERYRGKKR